MAITRNFRDVWDRDRIPVQAFTQVDGILLVKGVPLEHLESSLTILSRELDRARLYSCAYHSCEYAPGTFVPDQVWQLLDNPDRWPEWDDAEYEEKCANPDLEVLGRFGPTGLDLSIEINIRKAWDGNRFWEGNPRAEYDFSFLFQEDSLPDAERRPDECLDVLDSLLAFAKRLANDDPAATARYEHDGLNAGVTL